MKIIKVLFFTVILNLICFEVADANGQQNEFNNVTQNVSVSSIEEAGIKKLDKDLNKILVDKKDYVPGLAVSVFRHGENIYRTAIGVRHYAHEENDLNLPMNINTKVRIASISKMISAIAIMQLVEQEKIDLDTDVSKYLGFKLKNPNYPKTDITLRMLLSHTSSLRDGKVYSIPPEYSIEEFFSQDGKFYNEGENFAGKGQEPGKYFKYSNLNFGVIATIIEKITGERFDHYVKKSILEPLEIEGSFNLGDFDEEQIRNVGTIYQKQINDEWNLSLPWQPQIDDLDGELQERDTVTIQNPDKRTTDKRYSLKAYKIGTNGTLFSPQGGLRISLLDLEKILKMYLNGGNYNCRQIITEKSIKEMFAPNWEYDAKKQNGDTYDGLMASYGLAIQQIRHIDKDMFLQNRDIEMIGHFGDAYGLVAGIFVDLEHKNGFIYFTNGMSRSEEDSAGKYSGMYVGEEMICTAILDDLFEKYE